ncbi:RRP15 [Olea europaea subsp. europaea]|uniref:RRP15 n=1 Tax=Olea europaea subsp. europaea TaxID=158383 RepID=A0A8S0TBR2_OLEEU|nr:RRP15 [Olea europaea subsp. europaea]
MTEVMQAMEVKEGPRKRKGGNKKAKKTKKKQKMMPQGVQKKVNIDKRMKKLFQKRAREYNSDDDDDDVEEEEKLEQSVPSTREKFKKDEFEREFSDDDDGAKDNGAEENDVSEDEDGKIQPGIMKFTEGIKAFSVAFKKIVKKTTSSDVLGPVLSAHKKLLAEKLVEDELERKDKGEAKKEKHLVREKGHVKPANYLDSHEKYLLGIATKGVVKLFNAVNKAQNAQKGLNPSRSKDEKVIKKRRKEAFFSELGKGASQSAGTVAKVGASISSVDGEGPAWAPLRDNYMLTNSKLKDWDKMQDTTAGDDFNRASDSGSSSDDE